MLKELAKKLCLQGVPNMEVELQALGLEYRKGKSVADIRNAVNKARKNGMNKVEFEISMLEGYLKTILKELRAREVA